MTTPRGVFELWKQCCTFSSCPHYAYDRSDVLPTNSGSGPNRPEGPKHSPDHIRAPKDILLKPNMWIFLSKNLSLQAQTVQKWQPLEAEIQKLQQQKRIGHLQTSRIFGRCVFHFLTSTGCHFRTVWARRPGLGLFSPSFQAVPLFIFDPFRPKSL